VAGVIASLDESVVEFECAGATLRGVISRPATTPDTAVVIVVGGPQYRVGSHRQFVHLARGLAAHGIPCLRFDVRGMGDSDGTRLSFEHQDEDIARAIDALLVHHDAVRHVLLFGLCDGASAALMYVHRQRDPRVAGLMLMNPWVRTEATQSRAYVKHYYAKRLTDRAFWRKLARGAVSIKAPIEWVRALWRARTTTATAGTASFVHQMARGWKDHGHPLLVLLSDNDLTAREFEDAVDALPEWRGAWDLPTVSRCRLAGADHTLSQPGNEAAALDAIRQWIDCHWPSDGRRTGAAPS
jgi:exosortase A-associated hydrolase 1